MEKEVVTAYKSGSINLKLIQKNEYLKNLLQKSVFDMPNVPMLYILIIHSLWESFNDKILNVFIFGTFLCFYQECEIIYSNLT